ncbi:hypothetical protein HNP99_002815 [Flavobacterium sp. 28A]|uniref:AHH domain-containing protein n=1 Tax=Flavobacterium sp. 28A TaxID=2735895 RepID=UPI00156E6894|nr:AHH domain-containing protein [Flavobacterium sp. 28A]NRT16448.1 hypothetical protein [Flavobacterium sp. 28A]
MKNHFKNIVLFVLFSLSGIGGFGISAYAQLYPVQLTPIFNSPYSVKISDYATSMDTKMQLLINPNDISINNRQVRLKLFIQGNGINIQSSDYVQGLPPIYINGGELKTITNTDISALFRLENLQGISATQYANPLPEGMYSFCFEMYDYVTNQKISRKSCANLYLILNDPPLLNTPQNKELIAYTEFPNILFTWTPRQINATNVSYQFELKQLFDDTLDPQIGFQMAPVLHQETLFGTALLYNLSKPVLVPGMRYAWRVKAISTTGLSENAVFKNEGYSEIYSFKYTAACVAPSFVLSESQSTKSVKIIWQGVPEHTRYQIQYRKQGVRNAQWFSNYSQNTQSLLTDLEPGITYEFRVGSSCESVNDGVQSFTYSGINTFTTTIDNKEIAYNCGIVPEISITNQKPLTNLIQSETFTAGDFPVTILELVGKNSPYSGKGYIIVPYLADTKIAVEFNSIVINTDYQLISGVVETSYNPEWKNVTDVEDFTGEGQGGQIEETVPFKIQDIVINANGDIVVNGTEGEQIIIPGGKDTVISEDLKDADGNNVPGKVYTVDSKGNGSNEAIAAAPDGKPTPANTDGVDASGQANAFTAQGASIAFTVNSSSKYAFDVMPKNATVALQKLYKKVDGVALPYKAVVNGFSDTLIATLTLTDTIVKPENIVFKTQNGALINATRNDKTFELTVKGNLSYAEEQILATVKQGDKWKVIGAFMLVHISPKEVNVALVPTDKVSEDKLDAIIVETQKTYNKVGIKINFKKEGILNINSVVSGNTITTEKNTITSTYSAEQQKINALYKSDSYVLFITDKTSSTGQQGYMRQNGQYGYVFNSANSSTPAHELGHGIFKLEHPFEQYNTTEKSTDLLMDYSQGTVLNHQDWKQINDPAFKFYGFQSQSSGALAGGGLEDLIMVLKNLATDSFIKCTVCEENKFEAVGGFDGSKRQFRKVSYNNKTYICLLASLKEGHKIDLITDDLLSYADNIAETQPEFAQLIEATKSTFSNKKDLLAVISNNSQLVSCDVIYPFSNDICAGGKMVDDQTLLNVSKELENCYYSDFLPKLVAGYLKEITTNSRKNQGIEFVKDGKVYKLNGDVVEEVKTPLTDDDIRNGKWTDTATDVKIRVTQNKEGVFQYQAIGIRSSLTVASGKTAKLKDLAAYIENQGNLFFQKYKVTEADLTPIKMGVSLNNDSEVFADGKNIAIDNNATFFKISSEGIGLLTTFLQTALIEETAYLNSTENNTTIHAPGLVTGSVESGATVVTDVTSLCSMVYDLSTDDKARSDMWTGLIKLKDAVKDEPSGVIPIFVQMLSGNTNDEWAVIADKQSDEGKKGHLYSRGVVTSVKSVLVGGALITKLPTLAEELVGKIEDVLKVGNKIFKSADELANALYKARSDIRKGIIDFTESRNLALEYFEHIKKTDLTLKNVKFDDWFENTFKKYEAGTPNFEAHHVIPADLLKTNPDLKKLLFDLQKADPDFKFDFNGLDNGIMLQKKSLSLDISGHTSHKKYNNAIGKKITEICNDSNLDNFEKFEEVQDLIKNTKEKLKKEVLLGNKDVNDIINF